MINKRGKYGAIGLLPFFLLLAQSLLAQNYQLSGHVRNKEGAALIAANVYVLEANVGAVSDVNGRYKLQVTKGTFRIKVTYLGYQTLEKTIEIKSDLQLDFELTPLAIVKSEVVVQAERLDQNISSSAMGRIDLKIEQIKSLPAFFGEVDILKSIQLLPGVQTAGEGNTGFYVRGGGPDQNLILLDDAVVYNAAHLFGFFSVFNADAIENATLIKGGMNAEYGGRLSSVLDIGLREGDFQKHHTEGGIGLIASRITSEGPILKDKVSYIFSARRTYADVLVDPFIPSTATAKGSRYHFYDLNMKVSYRIGKKDRLSFSAYNGRDAFLFNNQETGLRFEIPWGNTTATLRWNHIMNKRLSMSLSAIHSNFDFATAVQQSQFRFALNSGVRNESFKWNFVWLANERHEIKWGSSYTYHTFTPSLAEAQSGDNVFNPEGINKLNAHELALFIQDQWDVTDRIQINAGLRYSNYTQVGPYLFERFADNQLLIKLEERSFKPGERVVNYDGFEPRFSARIGINNASSVKLGVTRNLQYIHLASSSGNALPTDLWVPSTLKVKPQIGTQYSLGYFRNFKDNVYESSIEVYYKSLQNQIDFRDGAVNGLNSNIENDFVFGSGKSYGVELFTKKKSGQFTGWIGYTLSWAWREFPDIMNGRRFPYKFDRRHDLSLVGMYELDARWTLASTFVFATGNAFTVPESRYFVEGTIINQIGDRNNLRLANYHRLDISATYKPRKQPKNIRNEWVFALYNVYSRMNPYFVYLYNEGSIQQQSLVVEARQVSLFPIIPSVAWNFKF